MNKSKILFSILAILLGVFIFIYSGYDDSPGGQLLGLLIVIGSVVGLIKSRKKMLKYNMGKYKFVNLTIFIIFFGTALFEAFQKQNWIEVIIFLALGVLSLWADSKRKT